MHSVVSTPFPSHRVQLTSWITVIALAAIAFAMVSSAGGCSVRDEEVRPAAATRAWSDAVIEASRRGDEPRAETTESRGIEYVEGYAAGRRRATTEGLPMLLVFRATWCRWSGELAHGPLADRGVVAAARRFVCVTIDADRDADTCREFGVTGFPTVIVVDATGQERFRATGAAAAGRLALVMRELLGSPDRADRYAGGLDDSRL
jgi:thiol:disulfide interchange protein